MRHKTRISRRFATRLSLVLALLSPLAAGQEDDEDFFVFDEEASGPPPVSDPLESFNRAMFSLNDGLYRGVFKPVAVAYRRVPRGFRVSVANFFDNLGRPVSAMNALLQLDLANTGGELGRFAINSTFGILGLFDPASELGLRGDNEDLGQTLGRYGIGPGFYLVIPLMGPTTLRDALGGAGDTAMDPFLGKLEREVLIGVTFVNAETQLSLDQDTYEALYDRALDPYIFFRSAYNQNRAGEIEQ